MIASDARIFGPSAAKRADEVASGDHLLGLSDCSSFPFVTVATAMEPAVEAETLIIETDGRSIQVTPDQQVATILGIGDFAGARVEFVSAGQLGHGDLMLLAKRPTTGYITPPLEIPWACGVLLGITLVDAKNQHLDIRPPKQMGNRLATALNLIPGVQVRWEDDRIISDSPALLANCIGDGLAVPRKGRRAYQRIGELHELARRAYLVGFRDAASGERQSEIGDDRPYSSRSRELMLDLRSIHVGLGDWVGPVTEHKNSGEKRRHGFTARRLQLAGNLDEIVLDARFQYLQGLGEWVAQPVKRISQATTTEVVELGVSSGETLIADGFVLRVSRQLLPLIACASANVFQA